MSLALVKKYPIETGLINPQIKIISYLTEREKTLLVDFFVLDSLLMGNDKQQLLRLCQSIYERDCWVQCDCVAHEKPVFRFNRAISGKLYLHHITSRGSHHERCIFKEKQWALSSEAEKRKKPFLKKNTPINLISKKSFDILAEKKIGESPKKNASQSQRRSSLCRLLYRLLDDAALNVITHQQKISPFKALEEAAYNIKLQSEKRLLDYLYTSPSMLFKAAYALRDDKSPWSNDISRHALMLVKAQSFTEQSIEAVLPDGRTQTITVKYHIHTSSGRLGKRSAPFMAMILISDTPERPHFYEPLMAYIVPCYSEKSFVPVDSHYEREMLKRLYALQFEFSNKGLYFDIIKPLFDIVVFQGTENETSVLPDFIIKTSLITLVIEVNGSHEPEYLCRKARTHEAMASIGKVFSFDAFGAEKENRFSHGLAQCLIQIKNQMYPSLK